MSGEQEKANQRAFVEALYPGPRWKRRVRNMTDAQVFAIWKRESNKPRPQRRQKSGHDETPF